MAITTTWSIQDMKRTSADGAVNLVYWSLVAQSDGDTVYTATEGGKLRLDPVVDADDFIAYADLTEATVLDWVYESLIEGDETADDAKARIEADRTAKVQGQIDRAAAETTGKPW
jgi:hypothetical protein